ncbi:MAG: TrlF family AAA-like ATPase [Phocaeicola sp.]
MDTNKLFENGSVWLRADFHLHTKADKEFLYKGEDNSFATAYVAKLVKQNIKVGIITNHNKFDKEEYKAITKKARKEQIYILPGVELSVNDGANGVHTIIVFDPTQWLADGNDFINQFITTNFEGKHNYENENGRSNYNLTDTILKLDKFNKNYFVVMAHVEQNSGLLNEFDGGRVIDLGNNPQFQSSVIAFQKVRTNDFKTKITTWLKGKVPCFVEGSDPKSIEEVGKGEVCYVKLGDFNFEALLFALTDYRNRVHTKESPQIKNSYIKSIAFEGGLLKGKKLHFSPELNSLIGIRGSGKSSILEILRYTLNIAYGSLSVDKEYKEDLIKYVLKSGGKSVVEIVDKHGSIYEVVRIYGQKEDIYLNGVLQQDITIDAILKQPIYFGQKDLSSKNTDFETDLVNKLIGNHLREVKEKIARQKSEIQRVINELKSYANLALLKKETETIKANATHKLKLFHDKGVAEKLQLQTSFELDINRLQNFQASIDGYLDELQLLIQNHEYTFNQKLDSTTNPELFTEANRAIIKLSASLTELKNSHSEALKAKEQFEVILAKLKEKKGALKEDFAKIKREIDIPELNPDDFIKINREFETSKLKLIEIEKSEVKRVELEQLLNEAVDRLDNLWHEQYSLVKAEVDKINRVGGKLQIEVNYKAKKEKFTTRLKELLKGTGIRDTTYNTLSNEYADFIEMRKDAFLKVSESVTESQLAEIKNRFQTNLFDCLTFQVPNQIAINYEGKPLDKHSLGQRASALILFLLSQKENDIILIDQPEDDLDNQTIYQDVIHEIKRLKGDMQFIFATHNANIPVLGDSEMVLACEYVPESEIRVEQGGIDCQAIQDKIIRIMEGGQEAFDIRKSIYKNWENRKR